MSLDSLKKWALKNRGVLIFFALLILFFTTLRTKSTEIATDDLSAILYDGTPTVLEFYSNT